MHPNQSGAAANLSVCVAAVICGFYLLRKIDQNFKNELRFVSRAYVCWLLAWMAWIATWAMILFAPKLPISTSSKDILNLAGSDLHAVILILCYFFLTRGSTYKPSQALSEGTFLALILSVGYAALYVGFARDTALTLHKEWGLVLGAVSNILVGWGFLLRYNTRIMLVMGFIYGFAQPAAFAAVLTTQGHTVPDTTRIAVQIVMAALKILLATSFTICILQRPSSAENLVRTSTSSFSLKALEPQMIFIIIQSFVLLSLFGIFLTILVPTEYLYPVEEGIKVAGSFATVILFIVAVFSWMRKRFGADTDPSKVASKIDVEPKEDFPAKKLEP